MRRHGIAYKSSDILDLLNDSTLSPGIEIIGLNFKLRSTSEEVGAAISSDEYLIIEQVLFFTESIDFDFRTVDTIIPAKVYLEGEGRYGRSVLKLTELRRIPKSDFEYRDESFHFAFFSSDELKVLAAISNKIIFSGSKLTFGLLTDGVDAFVGDRTGFDPDSAIFTLKAESDLRECFTEIPDRIDITEPLEGTMSISFEGQPCPPVWIPTSILTSLTSTINCAAFKKAVEAWKEAVKRSQGS